jgi:hypothetical protein
MLELLTVSEVVADQSHGENSGQNRGEGAQDAEITSDSDLLHELNR